jgi:hypothetical protein
VDQKSIVARSAVEPAWRGCVRFFLAALLGLLALFLLCVVLIDPYDAGRFPTFMPAGTSTDLPATLNISRGRDPRFNALTLGDSRAVLIDAQRLSRRTDLRFVQMAVEGASVSDQIVYLRWFARHHPTVEAIALLTDNQWCDRGPTFPHTTDFPTGLYASSDFPYLRATLSSTSLRMMQRRLSYALGRSSRIDPAHFVDMASKYPWRLEIKPATWHPSTAAGSPPPRDLPALRLLEEALAELPSEPRLVLWTAPYFVAALPPPNTEEARDDAACKATLRAWADRRPHAAFIDFQIPAAGAERPENFLDVTHASRRLLAETERDIAAAFSELN